MTSLNEIVEGLVTDESAVRFESDGYVVARGVIEPDRARDAALESAKILETLTAGIRTGGPGHTRVTWWRTMNGVPFILKVKPIIDLGEQLSGVATDPQLNSLLRVLLNARRDAILLEDKLLFKQRLEGATCAPAVRVLPEDVRKHTDAVYNLKRGWSSEVLTVAVCLDDCPVETGPVCIWPGSHRRCFDYHQTEEQGPVIPDELAPEGLSVPLLTTRGDVLVWHSGLVHASQPNLSLKPRRLLVMSFEPPPKSSRTECS